MSRFNNPAALRKPKASRGVPAPTPPAQPTGLLNPRVHAPVAEPVSTPTRPAWKTVTAADGGIGKIGFAAALAYIFIRFALLSDAITALLHFKPYLAYFTAPIALIAVLFTGGISRALRYKPGVFFCCFVVWLVVATPFSVWRGGSAHVLFDAFEADFSMLFMITGLTTTWQRFRLVLYTIAAGGVCDFLLCTFYGSSVEGRFSLAFGTLANPNDLATHVLFILPLCAFVFLVSKRFSAAKPVMAVTIVGILVIVLRTGSRAGVLSMLGLALYLIFRGSAKLKIAALVSVPLLIAIAALILPADVKWRYFSLFTSDAPAAESASVISANGSEEARKALLINSISETIHNPLVGVGPGQFAVAEAAVARELGKRASWQVTHNSYTQVSAEAGIPAALFFVAALFGSMGLLYKVHARSNQEARLNHLSTATFWLLVATIGFCINIFFAALAYGFYEPTIVALAVSAMAIAESDSPHPVRKLF